MYPSLLTFILSPTKNMPSIDFNQECFTLIYYCRENSACSIQECEGVCAFTQCFFKNTKSQEEAVAKRTNSSQLRKALHLASFQEQQEAFLAWESSKVGNILSMIWANYSKPTKRVWYKQAKTCTNWKAHS